MKRSTSIGRVLFEMAIYVIRFCGVCDFGAQGISNAARKGNVAYSERSRRIIDGDPGTDRSMSSMVSITAACKGGRVSTSGLKSGELGYVRIPTDLNRQPWNTVKSSNLPLRISISLVRRSNVHSRPSTNRLAFLEVCMTSTRATRLS